MEYLTDDYMRSDNHIIGLLRANQWKISTASKFLKKVLRWRNFNKMDALGEAEANFDMLAQFPYKLNGVTLDGCPVLDIYAGLWKFADFFESAEFVRDATKSLNVHESQMVEKLRLAVKKLSPKCDQGIVIVDVKDFEMRNIATPHVIGMIAKFATDFEIYYGNILKSLSFINTPPEFLSIVNIIKTSMGHTGKLISDS